jgi:hypothetical protein
VAQVDIATGRVKAHLQPEGLSLFQQLSKFTNVDDFRDATLGNQL